MAADLDDPETMWSLQGRVALVTGASRGLGWAIARALGAAGAHVVLTARDEALLHQRAHELATVGASASIACYDATSEPDVRRHVSRTEKDHGRLDILVNNAGISSQGSLASTTTTTWREIVEADLTASFVHAREAAPALSRHGTGRIVNISSVWGVAGKAKLHAYTAAKHGVIGLTRSLAAELGPSGVTVNAVAPGYCVTDMNRALVEDTDFYESIRSMTALRRWGQPPDIGAAVRYLASDAAAYMTGQVLSVDGGILATSD